MATKRNFSSAKLNAKLKDHISQVKHILFPMKTIANDYKRNLFNPLQGGIKAALPGSN